MDCSSVHGIRQARVLEWLAIAFSKEVHSYVKKKKKKKLLNNYWVVICFSIHHQVELDKTF